MTLPKLSTSGEPVLVVSAVGAALGWISTFLVAHGVISSTHASTIVQAIGPTLVSVAALGFGVLVRKYVSPAVKVVEADAAKFGLDLTGQPEVAAFLAALGLDPDGNPQTSSVITADGPLVAQPTTTGSPATVTMTTNLTAGPPLATPPAEPPPTP